MLLIHKIKTDPKQIQGKVLFSNKAYSYMQTKNIQLLLFIYI